MRRLAVALAAILSLSAPAAARAADPTPEGLDRWSFLIGDWRLVERRYGFDAKLIGTKTGHSRFSPAMHGTRIEELHTLVRDTDTTVALQVFVYDPKSGSYEIARTDSDHFVFSVLTGTMKDGRLEMVEKNPNPQSDISRRFTYWPGDGRTFRRRLEFSQDGGKSWFVRSEWDYTRE